MTMHYYTYVNAQIKVIQEWLKSRLGFCPTRPQVIQYCIYNIRRVDDEVIHQVRGVAGVGADVTPVPVSEDCARRVRQIVKELKGYSVNMTLMLTVIIIVHGEVAKHSQGHYHMPRSRLIVEHTQRAPKRGRKNTLAPTSYMSARP